MIIVGVDTGGTFTDIIYRDQNEWKAYKLLSTPHNPAEAVLNGLKTVIKKDQRQIIHGSTVATNAILERKGVRTALISNAGFEDVIAIGRQNRSRLYDLQYKKELEIIPSSLRFGIEGRIDKKGKELIPLNLDKVRNILQFLQDEEVESVAVCLLFSFAAPEHELKIGQMLQGLDIPFSLSHQILAEFREFERTSTTVINAYVSPKMEHYLAYLLDNLKKQDLLRIMQSNGGSISAQTAMTESVRTILSGPAGGAVGAREIGQLAGYDKLITFDMGGTSTDVSLIDGQLSLTLESSISGYPVKTPMIDIHTVGAGGGSIAAVDGGGSLTVGPQSAGADPGPVCYGTGENLTVTDANLYLGRLIPEHFLGGKMSLHSDRLESKFQELGLRLGLSPIEAAEGIIAVANVNMERAIRVISVERGFDPREFCLFSFGGAGGLHAAYLASLLSMPLVFIPKNPGILSAVGMLMADVLKDYSQTVMLPGTEEIRQELDKVLSPLLEKGIHDLSKEGIKRENIILERFLDMRYEGQSFEIITPYTADFIEQFHVLHERMYGYRNSDKALQVVNVRLRARGVPVKPQFIKADNLQAKIPESAELGSREVIFEGKKYETQVYQREELLPGNSFSGPALLVEYTSTLLVPPFAQAEVDSWGNLILKLQEDK